MKDFKKRVDALEKEAKAGSNEHPFPLFIYEDGVLDRGDGSEKEVMSKEELDKLTKGRGKPFVIVINRPVLA